MEGYLFESNLIAFAISEPLDMDISSDSLCSLKPNMGNLNILKERKPQSLSD